MENNSTFAWETEQCLAHDAILLFIIFLFWVSVIMQSIEHLQGEQPHPALTSTSTSSKKFSFTFSFLLHV